MHDDSPTQQKRQLPQPTCVMINTSEKEESAQASIAGRRPQDILYEESILTLTDSEYTSLDSSNHHATTKRRKLAPDRTANQDSLFCQSPSPYAPSEDYLQLRLQLVDQVAKAMQLGFQSLPLPAEGHTSNSKQPKSAISNCSDRTFFDEVLMIKRTFLRAHHGEQPGPPQLATARGELKLIKHEYYLMKDSQQCDETLSSSSTVLSTTDQQHQQHLRGLQHSEEFKDQACSSIGSICTARQAVPIAAPCLAEFMDNLDVQTRAYLQARRLAN